MNCRAQVAHKKQKGFSLLELTVVIAVVFGLIGFGISAAPQLFSSMNSVGELSELPTVIMNVKKSAKDRPNYNGLTIDTLARSNVFPEGRATIPSTGAATVQNQWGGAVTGAVGTLNATDDIYRLVSQAVPKQECIDTVKGVAKMVRRIYVDAANSATAGGGSLVKADGGTVTDSTLATACDGSAAITFDIGKS